jgi:hypothetical protein
VHIKHILTLSIRYIFAFKNEERETKDMIAVPMGNQQSIDVCWAQICSLQLRYDCRGCVDKNFLINENQGVKPSFGTKGVATA